MLTQAELCGWAGVPQGALWEVLEPALHEKTSAWAEEGCSLSDALPKAEKRRAAAQADVKLLIDKRVPPASPTRRMAEAESRKWEQRAAVVRLLLDVDRFHATRKEFEARVGEGKRNLAKVALADMRSLRDRYQGIEPFDQPFARSEALFEDTFGQGTPVTPAPGPKADAEIRAAPEPGPQPEMPVDSGPSGASPGPGPLEVDLEGTTAVDRPATEQLRMGETLRELRANQRVFRRYHLERLLSRGGMGVVWLAKDELLARRVALKFLPEIVRFDAASIAEMKQETLRSLELTHPNIIRVHDFAMDGELAAISMEYVDGPTFSAMQAKKAGGVFEVEGLREWVRQLCEALAHAHAQGPVVHRDLKPSNLMVTQKGQLKVVDFGISRSLSESFSRVTLRGKVCGTPGYMSPQQVGGEKPSESDDIYALGATLYALLTSKPPFHTGDITWQVQNKAPPSMTERRRELGVPSKTPIPPAWEKTVAACLARDPAQRPPSATAVAELLGLRAGGKPESGRSRLQSAVLAITTLAVAGFATWAFLHPKDPTPPPPQGPATATLQALRGAREAWASELKKTDSQLLQRFVGEDWARLKAEETHYGGSGSAEVARHFFETALARLRDLQSKAAGMKVEEERKAFESARNAFTNILYAIDPAPLSVTDRQTYTGLRQRADALLATNDYTAGYTFFEGNLRAATLLQGAVEEARLRQREEAEQERQRLLEAFNAAKTGFFAALPRIDANLLQTYTPLDWRDLTNQAAAYENSAGYLAGASFFNHALTNSLPEMTAKALAVKKDIEDRLKAQRRELTEAKAAFTSAVAAMPVRAIPAVKEQWTNLMARARSQGSSGDLIASIVFYQGAAEEAAALRTEAQQRTESEIARISAYLTHLTNRVALDRLRHKYSKEQYKADNVELDRLGKSLRDVFEQGGATNENLSQLYEKAKRAVNPPFSPPPQ